jgi:hypothetical protein
MINVLSSTPMASIASTTRADLVIGLRGEGQHPSARE